MIFFFDKIHHQIEVLVAKKQQMWFRFSAKIERLISIEIYQHLLHSLELAKSVPNADTGFRRVGSTRQSNPNDGDEAVAPALRLTRRTTLLITKLVHVLN